MEKLSGTSSNPATYPTGGTFGQLLDWHLKWGTRPGCNHLTEQGNTPWGRIRFSQLIHELGCNLESTKKNISNWTAKGKIPHLNDNNRVELIYLNLFGDDPNLREWKLDLERALEQGRREQAARIARREIIKATGVPSPVKHFMGRDSVVDALVTALLSSERSGAVLVQGGPGIGKTELTKAIAHHAHVAARFGERRWFISLETASTAIRMQEAIIRALGHDLQIGFDVAINGLRGKQSLLVLDNLETPWESSKERVETENILSYLHGVDGLSMLASFRGGGSVGDIWQRTSLQGLSEKNAVSLFASIAGDWVTDDPLLRDFVSELGGIPLAIDLVSRRADVRMSLAPLWREWQKTGTDFVKRDELEESRLNSLSRSIQLSLQSPRMVAPDGALDAFRLFGILGLLPAGLSPEDRDNVMTVRAFDAEERLLRTGLAISDSDRVDLLPPIRDYAKRHSKPSDEDKRSTAEYFLSLTKILGGRIGEINGGEAIDQLDKEIANIESAFRIAIDINHSAMAMAAIESFDQLISIKGISSRIPDELSHLCFENGDFKGQAMCISYIGNCARSRSDYNTARIAYEKALKIYHQVGDVAGQAYCISFLGGIFYALSDTSAAHAAYEYSLTLYQSLKDELGVANCIQRLGDIALSKSAFSESLSAYEQAASIYKYIGVSIGEANCLSGIAEILFRNSQFDMSKEYFDKSRLLYNKSGDRKGEAMCILGIGNIALSRLDHKTAIECYELALSIYENAGYVSGEADCITRIAETYLNQSKFDAARSAFERAIPVYRQIGDILGEANCVKGFADILHRLSEYDSAHSTYENAILLYHRAGDIHGEANCLTHLGEIALSRSDRLAACTAYERALPLYRRGQYVNREANCLFYIAGIMSDLADYRAANLAYEQALLLYRQLGNYSNEGVCAGMLGGIAQFCSDYDAARTFYGQALSAYQKANNARGIELSYQSLRSLP